MTWLFFRFWTIGVGDGGGERGKLRRIAGESKRSRLLLDRVLRIENRSGIGRKRLGSARRRGRRARESAKEDLLPYQKRQSALCLLNGMQATEVKQVSRAHHYPMIEEYDFRNDFVDCRCRDWRKAKPNDPHSLGAFDAHSSLSRTMSEQDVWQWTRSFGTDCSSLRCCWPL